MNDNDFRVTEAMIVYGGSFVKALGALCRHADADNLQRLKNAFPEYWAQYKAIAEATR